MQERFDGFFPEEPHTEPAAAHAESLLQEDDHDDHEITEKKVEKALQDHFRDKPKSFVQHHLSLLQRQLEEIGQHDEEHGGSASLSKLFLTICLGSASQNEFTFNF